MLPLKRKQGVAGRDGVEAAPGIFGGVSMMWFSSARPEQLIRSGKRIKSHLSCLRSPWRAKGARMDLTTKAQGVRAEFETSEKRSIRRGVVSAERHILQENESFGFLPKAATPVLQRSRFMKIHMGKTPYSGHAVSRHINGKIMPFGCKLELGKPDFQISGGLHGAKRGAESRGIQPFFC
jgi:hypothetical protein